MILNTRQEILEVLHMPQGDFDRDIVPRARTAHRAHNGDTLSVMSMMGFSNICANHCLYCGMRGPNSKIPRYCLDIDQVLDAVRLAREEGFTRLFLISGENPQYDFRHLLQMVSGAKALGMEHIALACGEFSLTQYKELRDAGAAEYVIKFEMGQAEVFDRLNPSTNFAQRMQAIRDVKDAGLLLASGNIVGYPGQSVEQVAEDILLIQSLGIHWAPVVPYLPAANTPLAAEGGPGDRLLNLRELAILRLSLPEIRITGGQPGENPADGFSSIDGTQAALALGADLLFADLLPAARRSAFRVVDERNLLGLEHIRRMADMAGMTLSL